MIVEGNPVTQDVSIRGANVGNYVIRHTTIYAQFDSFNHKGTTLSTDKRRSVGTPSSGTFFFCA